jgi:hypothetical protein
LRLAQQLLGVGACLAEQGVSFGLGLAGDSIGCC